MTAFLATYRPLIRSAERRRATQRFGLPPFIDDSCRREPEFESPFPSITALCHGALFVPRVNEGDTVVYLTEKGGYLGVKERHWLLTAILTVIRVFATHEAAAEWYRAQGIEPPSNCMIAGSMPYDLEHGGRPGRHKPASPPRLRTLEEWNAGYR